MTGSKISVDAFGLAHSQSVAAAPVALCVFALAPRENEPNVFRRRMNLSMTFCSKMIATRFGDSSSVTQDLAEECLEPLRPGLDKDLGWRSGLDDLALVHEHNPVSHPACEAHLVRHAHHRHPAVR
jgi:hypothetical protein